MTNMIDEQRFFHTCVLRLPIFCQDCSITVLTAVNDTHIKLFLDKLYLKGLHQTFENDMGVIWSEKGRTMIASGHFLETFYILEGKK